MELNIKAVTIKSSQYKNLIRIEQKLQLIKKSLKFAMEIVALWKISMEKAFAKGISKATRFLIA